MKLLLLIFVPVGLLIMQGGMIFALGSFMEFINPVDSQTVGARYVFGLPVSRYVLGVGTLFCLMVSLVGRSLMLWAFRRSLEPRPKPPALDLLTL